MSPGTKGLVLFGMLVAIVVITKPRDGSIASRAQQDDVMFVPDDDPAMRAAFKKAQATLDDFLAVKAAPPAHIDSFAVKVAVTDAGRSEYFWIDPFERHGEEFSGRISNTPRVVSNVREGEEIRFRRAAVVDWTYTNTQENRMYGNFTACALLSHQSKSAAEEFRAEYGLDCDA